ncbi:fibronectin type III domain-containing protein [Catalinimonas niigatensis]|uniref:fibronectin type III domain-containing protein n=1 Tax=Catalinimonas niigatensis TaxID=1397264 RepID=UPI0026651368|nr:fibronectin type III domain-containing protein [Catalinimonas niigatensis]WPP52413.1 metallophosphoesterase [Catalinimonas niigatensis]
MIFKSSLISLLCTLLSLHGFAQTTATSQQTLLVRPYLQDATPNSIKVMWETSQGEESTVEWGLTPKLGRKTSGTAFDINYTDARIHEVEITGLKRLTMYYYRVKTGKLVSDIYQFKTPPFARDQQAFQLVAMSDMQRDHNNPDKFSEIIQEGVLSYLKKEFEGEVPENLALVMIPGDLVADGVQYDQWKEHFFDPAQELFSQVPVYPVPGNHERNSTFYFKYFSLPKNGTPAYEEHWWYKDYGNTRIIGLDSNEGYRNRTQLNWLDEVLALTRDNDSIDFVFAQLHHPHKSELWLDGEEDFTGEVVKRLEAFSTETGKPSIHFFGHTHGYSRGQSRDHKHLWVNVATAGGKIDYWGEYAQKNYDEFTVTQDEYGFVMVEVDPNQGDPKFTVKRFSRGNENLGRDNELRDSVTVWKFEKKPRMPQASYPVNETVNPVGLILKANIFSSDLENAAHGASHWQISKSVDFSEPIMDSWKQYEDWYAYQNLQKDDDLTDEKVQRLENNSSYFWRVRYRDQNLNWSDWSAPAKFSTNGQVANQTGEEE